MIGMAGATVAIPTSISSLESNPAGLTMTMGSVTAQINSNDMEDRTIAGAGQKKIQSNQWGVTVTPGDWGYALTYYTPNFEGGSYTSPNTGRTSEYEISLKQLRLSASRSLFRKKLSLGLSFEVNHALRKLGTEEHAATDLSYNLGAIYHVRRHFLVGVSYSPAEEIGGGIVGSGIPELQAYAQPVRKPMLLTVGTGWIPNRFFKAGFSVGLVGSTKNTALLRDQSITVGDGTTLQPRLGASYVIAEYDHLKIASAAGTYYETSRVSGIPNRLHGTASVQVNPYFINLGIGVDRATDFNNLFISIGFDIVRGLRTFDIIPKEPIPSANGFWPAPLEKSADGLPDALTVGERKTHSAPSAEEVGEIIENIPTNIENKISGKPPVKPGEKSSNGKSKKRKKKSSSR
jgi:hypothetical protein